MTRQVYLVVVQQPENVSDESMREYIDKAVQRYRKLDPDSLIANMSDKAFYVKVA